VPTTLHTEFLWLFGIFCISILVVVLKGQLLWASHFCVSGIPFHWWPTMGWSQGFNSWHFSLSHHVQPVMGANPVFSPVNFFPWTWSCQNMKLTPHYCPLRRRFLHSFWCTINNISNIILTAFSMTILQNLRTVMPHSINNDNHKVTFKYNFWMKDRIGHKLCNLLNFWNICIYMFLNWLHK
jgi:hypothetical protein